MNLDTFLDATFNTKLCLTLLHSVWQAPLLGLIAAGINRLSRRRSVERSYLLHTVALVATLLLLPVTYQLVDGAASPTVTVDARHDVPAPVVEAEGLAMLTPTSSVLNSPPPAWEAAPIAPVDGPAASPPSSVAKPPTATDQESASVWSIVATWIAGLYAAGVVVMLIRLWRGFWQADRLVATAIPLNDGPVAGLLQALAREWSLRAVPALAVAERIVVPQVVGLLRPTILLPASALTGLSEDELRMILAHELAHIRRHDLWINLLQRLAETVLFFNPALWYLSRRISTLREFCCDEQICGTPTERESDLRTRYATALLHVAELSQRPPREPQPTDLATLAAAGRSPSELRRRIAHLFGEPMREPLRLSRGGALALIAATVLLLAGPAVWETKQDVVSAQDNRASESDESSKNATTEKLDAGASIEEGEYTFPISVSGRAVNKDGQPIAGAQIFLAADGPGYRRLAETKSKQDGTYRFEEIPLPIKRPDVNNGEDAGSFEVFGIAEGYALAWRPSKAVYPTKSHADEPNWANPEEYDFPTRYGRDDRIELDVTFGPPTTIHGRIVDDAGQPLEGTQLAIRYSDTQWEQEDYNSISFIGSLNALNERAVVPPRVKARMTDADGRFEFTGLPKDYRWQLDVRPPGHSSKKVWAVTHDGIASDATGRRIYSGNFEVVFPKPQKVKLRVVYAGTDTPAPKVGVGGNVTEAGFWETTNADGLVEAALPAGEYALTVSPRYQTPYLRTTTNVVVSKTEFPQLLTLQLNPAAVVDLTVVDADTGKPLVGADVWLDKPNPNGGKALRSVHGYRSWEVETRISHYESPRSDENGKMRVNFEPGTHRIGVGLKAFPEGYVPVDRDGQLIECRAGEVTAVVFKMKNTTQQQESPNDEAAAGGALEAEVSDANGASQSDLPADSVVEVVAIGTHGKEPQRWWDADGNVLKSVPFLWTAEDKAPAEGNWRRIVIRTLPLPEDAEITWKINGSRNWWGVQVAFEKDKLPGQYFSRYFSIPNDRRSVQLRVGIATGPWKTIAENGRPVAARNRPKNKNLVFSEAIQTDRGTVLVVSHNDFDENFRVIAVDKQGKTHDSTARGGVSAGRIYQTKAVFPNLATKDVDHFEFQVRDYTWVETDDLPLQPRDAKEGAFVEPGTDQERVHSALPATGDKTGRLLSQEKRFELLVRGPEGEPVPQATVEVRTKPLPTAEQIVVGKYVRAGNYGAFVQADERGRVVLEVPTPPERFNVSIITDGYGPYWAGWSSHEHPQPIPARFVAELDAGWSVGGLVVDEQGEPIAGAEVHPSIRFKKRPGDTDPLGMGRTMTTDAGGAWRFDSVPASKNDVHVSIDHPDYMPSRLSLARSPFGLQPDQPPNATIALKRGLTVTGRVTDADGQPIAGALVRTKFHNDLRKATTDKDGAYELKGCEPRMARIVVSAKGKAVDMQDVRVDPEMEPVDFQMQPGGTVRIHVVDEEGHGIPKARIFFQRWRGDRYEYFEFDHVNQYTDENGVWEWHEAPHDEFKADICRPGGMQLTYQPLVARDEEYVFSPPRALVVSGHVIDARTKEPIKTFRVTPGLRNADPGIRMDWIPSQSYEATDGQYRVSFNRDEPAHLVRIEADGYLVAISRDIRGDEGEVDVDFALQPADDIAATILTAEGQPAAGAKIALGVAGSQISIKAGEIDGGQTYATQLTADEQGRFSIPARTEAFQLVVTHPAGFAYLKSVDGPIPDKITLTAWARAEGTFRVGAKPAAGVTLSMFGDGIHSWGNDVPHIFTTHDVTTGADGEFVFDRVFPGRRSIGRRILLMVDEGATEVTSSLRVPADFVAGETTTLNLGGRGRAVIGKLEPPDGYEGQVLWNFALVNATVVPERPPMVQPPADVARDPKKLKAWWQKWETTAEGQAWALHQAYDRQRWGSLYVTATIDRDGSFRIDDLPAGQYSLSVRFSKQGAGVLRDYHFDVPTSDLRQPPAALDLGRLTLQAQ